MSDTELRVILKAKELAKHTFIKTCNANHYPKKLRFSLVDKMQNRSIDSTDGLGLPLGNQAAQVYALLMLNGMDHMITGELGIVKYGRYMDDFYLIHHDKQYLK